MKEIKVQVPEGITEFSVQVNGETATVVYETRTEKKGMWQPQDGEIVFAATRMGIQHFIFPFGYIEQVVFNEIIGSLELGFDKGGFIYSSLRPATEEEKKIFHDALKERGLRWNAEEKKVEKIPRWRAELGRYYYYVDTYAEVNYEEESFDSIDDLRYERCNYFKTREAAGRVAKQIMEIFKNSKAE